MTYQHLAIALAGLSLQDKPHRKALNEASINAVNVYYQGMGRLQIVQDQCNKLCAYIGLGEDPVPSSITKCKKLLENISIHIVDFVEGRYDAVTTRKGLKARCQEIGTYPCGKSKSEGLRCLLRKL